MGYKLDEGLLLFLALVGLYSPIAAVSSYAPLLQFYPKKEQVRIALMIAAVPLMLGWGVDSEAGPDPDPSGQPGVIAPWSSVVFVPFTFPLTIGGATDGLLISFRGQASGAAAARILVVAAVTCALAFRPGRR